MCACNKVSSSSSNCTYKKVHVDTVHFDGCFTIEMKVLYRNGIKVETKEAGSLFLSDGQYALIEDECPFCAAKEETIPEVEIESHPNAVG